MDIVIYIYLTLMILFILFILIGYIIEGYLPETHPVMKWWRRNIVGLDPEQKEPKDDIYE